MLTLCKLILTLFVGAALGLAATYWAVQQGFGQGIVRVGPWVANPALESSAADPYSLARLAQSSEIPLGLAEGLTFIAKTDDSGRPLLAACVYKVSGNLPVARFWTLALDTVHGRLIDNPARRYGFTSQEIVRSADGSFEILVSRAARAGNWLPLGDTRKFVLVLRLYDTPTASTAGKLEATAMPSIVRTGCA